MKTFRHIFLMTFCLFTSSAASPLAAQEPPANAPQTSAEQPSAPPAPVPPPPPGKTSPPDISMEAYGTSNPQCLEWTDSCQICARDDQNRNACSTPGIACLPGDISCKKERK
jgi:hypothetical protein